MGLVSLLQPCGLTCKLLALLRAVRTYACLQAGHACSIAAGGGLLYLAHAGSVVPAFTVLILLLRLQMVQHFTELDLRICSARISSDGGWFVDGEKCRLCGLAAGARAVAVAGE